VAEVDREARHVKMRRADRKPESRIPKGEVRGRSYHWSSAYLWSCHHKALRAYRRLARNRTKSRAVRREWRYMHMLEKRDTLFRLHGHGPSWNPWAPGSGGWGGKEPIAARDGGDGVVVVAAW
jgi:hypothetical protein